MPGNAADAGGVLQREEPLGMRAAAGILAAVAAIAVLARQAATLPEQSRPAPEFPTIEASRWLGEPQRLAALRGRVVLLDVWTFG